MRLSSSFTRAMLAEVSRDVRKHVPGITLMKAWVHSAGRGQWEFHFQEFYWHGSAADAYDARARGWSAYLAKLGAEGYKPEGD